PMMFVVRDGRWLDMTGRTFGRYLEGDGAGLTPTRADWEMHLTTLFPEVRLKAYVEVRGSDSAEPEAIGAQAALGKRPRYFARARAGAWELMDGIPFAERLSFHRDVAREGLRARLRGVTALELARRLIALAEEGLGASESRHLAILRRDAFARGE